jgi:very-short-patch-repair endonuclease
MREDNKRLRAFARQMRKEPTPAEKHLWRIVRNRRLAEFKFRHQHPFGPYILDFYCPAARLIIELDGDSHADEQTQQHDAARTAYLERRGVLTLRFWNVELAENEDGVVARIFDECRRRTARPGTAGASD